MKDVNGKEIRVGQRVRRTLTEEGTAVEVGGHPFWPVLLDPNRSSSTTVTVEVLAEPRIPEPKGLGAVVEAALKGGGSRLPFTLVDAGGDSVFRWCGRGHGWTKWDDLIDPVLLSEGWTDGDA